MKGKCWSQQYKLVLYLFLRLSDSWYSSEHFFLFDRFMFVFNVWRVVRSSNRPHLFLSFQLWNPAYGVSGKGFPCLSPLLKIPLREPLQRLLLCFSARLLSFSRPLSTAVGRDIPLIPRQAFYFCWDVGTKRQQGLNSVHPPPLGVLPFRKPFRKGRLMCSLPHSPERSSL